MVNHENGEGPVGKAMEQRAIDAGIEYGLRRVRAIEGPARGDRNKSRMPNPTLPVRTKVFENGRT